MYAQLACFEGCQSSLGLVQAKAQLLCLDAALVTVSGVSQVGHNGANLAIKAGFHCIEVPGRDLIAGNSLVLQGSQ